MTSDHYFNLAISPAESRAHLMACADTFDDARRDDLYDLDSEAFEVSGDECTFADGWDVRSVMQETDRITSTAR